MNVCEFFFEKDTTIMMFSKQTTHSFQAPIKRTLLSLSMILCLGASFPSLVMGSESELCDNPLNKEKYTPKNHHGYSKDVFNYLEQQSPFVVHHDVIQTQIDNKNANNSFLQKQAEKIFSKFWSLVLAQKTYCEMHSGLFLFQSSIYNKSSEDLENFDTDAWDKIKPKSVSLPSSDTSLSVKDEPQTSLAAVEEELLTDLARFIHQKMEQNQADPLQHVVVDDLSQSFVAHTENRQKSYDETMKKILRNETANTIHILNVLRAMLDMVVDDTNTHVQKSASLSEGFKALLGFKEKFEKAKNTKDEIKQYEHDLLAQRQSLKKLLDERRTYQKNLREKMIDFAKILKAPGANTYNIELKIQETWLLDHDVTYGGYFWFIPNITTHGFRNAVSSNLFGARHARSLQMEEKIHPLIQYGHVQDVFESFKNYVTQGNPDLEKLLLGKMNTHNTSPTQPTTDVHLPSVFDHITDPLRPASSNATQYVQETQRFNPKEVNVGDIASKAGDDIQRILNNL